MIWLTWRQFRTQAIITAAVLAVFAIGFVITGIQVENRFNAAGLTDCHLKHDCQQLANTFLSGLRIEGFYKALFLVGVAVLYLLPALIGLFWGAPLIAREFETGTVRLAWSQSVSWHRWLAIKLGLIGLAAMATAGLFSLLITWWSSPIDRALALGGPNAVIGLSRLDPGLFGARAIVPIGYAAFALALGVAFGVLIRRTVPAMGATLAVFVGVQIVWASWIRPHLITPAVARAPLNANYNELQVQNNGHMTVIGAWHDAGAWVLSNQTITPAGQVFTGPATSACQSGSPSACAAWLTSQNLRELVTFQPASRFWAFQWYETAIFILVAVALAGLSAWRISRRRLA